MSKNIFMALNGDNKFWIHICNLKYGVFHCWNPSAMKNVSDFYRGFWATASQIKSNCQIKECNPSSTDFLIYHWFFDIFIAYKPTFINMNFQLNEITVEDCVHQFSINYDMCALLFGHNVDWSLMNHQSINRESSNYWVWTPSGSNASLVSSIYTWFNSGQHKEKGNWEGWKVLWNLVVIPRVKVFI